MRGPFRGSRFSRRAHERLDLAARSRAVRGNGGIRLQEQRHVVVRVELREPGPQENVPGLAGNPRETERNTKPSRPSTTRGVTIGAEQLGVEGLGHLMQFRRSHARRSRTSGDCARRNPHLVHGIGTDPAMTMEAHRSRTSCGRCCASPAGWRLNRFAPICATCTKLAGTVALHEGSSRSAFRTGQWGRPSVAPSPGWRRRAGRRRRGLRRPRAPLRCSRPVRGNDSSRRWPAIRRHSRPVGRGSRHDGSTPVGIASIGRAHHFVGAERGCDHRAANSRAERRKTPRVPGTDRNCERSTAAGEYMIGRPRARKRMQKSASVRSSRGSRQSHRLATNRRPGCDHTLSADRRHDPMAADMGRCGGFPLVDPGRGSDRDRGRGPNARSSRPVRRPCCRTAPVLGGRLRCALNQRIEPAGERSRCRLITNTTSSPAAGAGAGVPCAARPAPSVIATDVAPATGAHSRCACTRTTS